MHLVVELFFDQATETAIRTLWHMLAGAGISVGSQENGARPHISVTVCQELDVGRFQTALALFAGRRPALEITLASWGVFPTTESVVFLTPIVTRELLVLHQDFHRRFIEFGGAAQPYYLPNNWVPHCTLAAGFASDLLPKVAEACQKVVWPIRGQLEYIGLVEYGPRREHFNFRFGT